MAILSGGLGQHQPPQMTKSYWSSIVCLVMRGMGFAAVFGMDKSKACKSMTLLRIAILGCDIRNE